MSVPGAVPYHRLSLTPDHRWWRPVLGTTFVFFVWFLAMMVVSILAGGAGAVAGRPDGPDGTPTFGDAGDTALSLIMLGTGIPVVLLGARAIQRRRPGTLSSVTGRLRRRWLGTCLLASLAALMLSLVLMALLVGLTSGTAPEDDGDLVRPGDFALSMALILPVLPLQTSAEEYLCRGWLLQAVGSLYRGIWPALLVQAVVFTALHGFGTVWGVIDLMVFALLTGWLTIRTGGLEAALALHFVNNLVGFTMSAAFGELASEETAADSSWQMALVDTVVLTLFAAAVLGLAARRGLDRTGVPAPVHGRADPQVSPTPWPLTGQALTAADATPATGTTVGTPASTGEAVPVSAGGWTLPGSDPWAAPGGTGAAEPAGPQTPQAPGHRGTRDLPGPFATGDGR